MNLFTSAIPNEIGFEINDKYFWFNLDYTIQEYIEMGFSRMQDFQLSGSYILQDIIENYPDKSQNIIHDFNAYDVSELLYDRYNHKKSEIHRRFIQYLLNGNRQSSIANKLGINISALSRWKNLKNDLCLIDVEKIDNYLKEHGY